MKMGAAELIVDENGGCEATGSLVGRSTVEGEMKRESVGRSASPCYSPFKTAQKRLIVLQNGRSKAQK